MCLNSDVPKFDFYTPIPLPNIPSSASLMNRDNHCKPLTALLPDIYTQSLSPGQLLLYYRGHSLLMWLYSTEIHLNQLPIVFLYPWFSFLHPLPLPISRADALAVDNVRCRLSWFTLWISCNCIQFLGQTIEKSGWYPFAVKFIYRTPPGKIIGQ